MSSCAESKRHYQVVSPEMRYYPYNGPPEPFVCFGFYLAENAKDAIRQAVADEAFIEWVTDARADRVPPFKGLKASLARCEHGVCWGCENGDEMTSCGLCREAWDEDQTEWTVQEFDDE